MGERWVTPPEVFEPLHAEFGFDLDAAADHETARLPAYLDSALTQSWPGRRIWLNPPYGTMLARFVEKAATEAATGKLVVALIPFRCRAAWWHQHVIGRATEVRCVRRRIHFLLPDGSRPKLTMTADSCLVVWHPGANAGTTTMTSWAFKDPT